MKLTDKVEAKLIRKIRDEISDMVFNSELDEKTIIGIIRPEIEDFDKELVDITYNYIKYLIYLKNKGKDEAGAFEKFLLKLEQIQEATNLLIDGQQEKPLSKEELEKRNEDRQKIAQIYHDLRESSAKKVSDDSSSTTETEEIKLTPTSSHCEDKDHENNHEPQVEAGYEEFLVNETTLHDGVHQLDDDEDETRQTSKNQTKTFNGDQDLQAKIALLEEEIVYLKATIAELRQQLADSGELDLTEHVDVVVDDDTLLGPSSDPDQVLEELHVIKGDDLIEDEMMNDLEEAENADFSSSADEGVPTDDLTDDEIIADLTVDAADEWDDDNQDLNADGSTTPLTDDSTSNPDKVDGEDTTFGFDGHDEVVVDSTITEVDEENLDQQNNENTEENPEASFGDNDADRSWSGDGSGTDANDQDSLILAELKEADLNPDQSDEEADEEIMDQIDEVVVSDDDFDNANDSELDPDSAGAIDLEVKIIGDEIDDQIDENAFDPQGDESSRIDETSPGMLAVPSESYDHGDATKEFPDSVNEIVGDENSAADVNEVANELASNEQTEANSNDTHPDSETSSPLPTATNVEANQPSDSDTPVDEEKNDDNLNTQTEVEPSSTTFENEQPLETTPSTDEEKLTDQNQDDLTNQVEPYTDENDQSGTFANLESPVESGSTSDSENNDAPVATTPLVNEESNSTEPTDSNSETHQPETEEPEFEVLAIPTPEDKVDEPNNDAHDDAVPSSVPIADLNEDASKVEEPTSETPTTDNVAPTEEPVASVPIVEETPVEEDSNANEQPVEDSSTSNQDPTATETPTEEPVTETPTDVTDEKDQDSNQDQTNLSPFTETTSTEPSSEDNQPVDDSVAPAETTIIDTETSEVQSGDNVVPTEEPIVNEPIVEETPTNLETSQPTNKEVQPAETETSVEVGDGQDTTGMENEDDFEPTVDEFGDDQTTESLTEGDFDETVENEDDFADQKAKNFEVANDAPVEETITEPEISDSPDQEYETDEEARINVESSEPLKDDEDMQLRSIGIDEGIDVESNDIDERETEQLEMEAEDENYDFVDDLVENAQEEARKETEHLHEKQEEGQPESSNLPVVETVSETPTEDVSAATENPVEEPVMKTPTDVTDEKDQDSNQDDKNQSGDVEPEPTPVTEMPETDQGNAEQKDDSGIPENEAPEANSESVQPTSPEVSVEEDSNATETPVEDNSTSEPGPTTVEAPVEEPVMETPTDVTDKDGQDQNEAVKPEPVVETPTDSTNDEVQDANKDNEQKDNQEMPTDSSTNSENPSGEESNKSEDSFLDDLNQNIANEKEPEVPLVEDGSEIIDPTIDLTSEADADHELKAPDAVAIRKATLELQEDGFDLFNEEEVLDAIDRVVSSVVEESLETKFATIQVNDVELGEEVVYENKHYYIIGAEMSNDDIILQLESVDGNEVIKAYGKDVKEIS